ncbi:hypothetical protein THASP1DRAFT_29435 [Thamnocephalis sphaerospora]|uniref:G-protein coupled receptors family 1 profile domain-containing protein n=1 Tax=Thamnocephalis sphaerospora TaxID=78915 RepID=A0A4P9XRP5_9FUNG|nr:hypothetical protein THASP1DRAFT_29435 [Thamnocephalis sphaerospora]|eukprot:RKP08766.1 hypothetical protein THASP1DRAFT_29435 [Thamnocephalis sphaerospora]
MENVAIVQAQDAPDAGRYMRTKLTEKERREHIVFFANLFLLFGTMIMLRCLANTRIAVRLLFRRGCKPLLLLNLMQSLTGLIYGVLFLVHRAPRRGIRRGPTPLLGCAAMVAAGSVFLAVSMIAIAALLLDRVLRVSRRSALVGWLGALMILLNAAVGMANYPTTTIHRGHGGQCTFLVNRYWTYSKLLADICTSLLLCTVFFSVLRRTMDAHPGVPAHRALYKEGILYVVAVMIVNFSCTLVVLSRETRAASAHILGLNMVACATIVNFMLLREKRESTSSTADESAMTAGVLGASAGELDLSQASMLPTPVAGPASHTAGSDPFRAMMLHGGEGYDSFSLR